MIKKIIKYFKKWGCINTVKNILYHVKTSERRKCFGGENAEDVVYIIRSIDDKSRLYTGPIHNLLANYFYVLSHIKYANERQWIPVVDQMNYPVYNGKMEKINGTMNPWEYFWEQPGRIALDDAYKSKNVVLSKRSWFMQWNMGYDAHEYSDKQTISMFYGLMKQAELNKNTQIYISKKENGLFPKESKILGVAVRYGGHSTNCYYHGSGHPIQPAVNELVELVKRRYEEWNMDYIFLTSDEQSAVEDFDKIFGDKLIVLPRKRCREGRTYNKQNPNPMYTMENIYQTSLDYLTEMELLAKCSALIGSITSGLRYAIIRNNMKYEHCEIIERGFFESG